MFIIWVLLIFLNVLKSIFSEGVFLFMENGYDFVLLFFIEGGIFKNSNENIFVDFFVLFLCGSYGDFLWKMKWG